ncbi:MAG: hypothetical protein QY328_14110 [Anaerolineales bacterium]|nr:MAG: hypothetical protein QY328_14110 [Anaerolineales bacterium]
MKNELLTSLVISISTQIPILLIWIAGISLSVYFRKRNPKKFLLTLTAFLVFLLDTIANSVFSAWIITNFITSGEPSPQMTQMAVGFISTLGSTLAWVVLFFAIFNPKFNSVEGIIK